MGYDRETELKRRAQYEWPWGQLSSAAYSLVDETVTVDGVTYGPEDVRRLLLERHRLASDLADRQAYAVRQAILLEQRERQLERNRRHLRLRTSALVRLIARKGPVLPDSERPEPPHRPAPLPDPVVPHRGW